MLVEVNGLNILKDNKKHNTKKVKPKIYVILVTNSSNPLSFLFANKSDVPPWIICDADSALPLWSKTTAINNIDTISNAISIVINPFTHYIL